MQQKQPPKARTEAIAPIEPLKPIHRCENQLHTCEEPIHRCENPLHKCEPHPMRGGWREGAKGSLHGAKRNHQATERKPPRSGGERLRLVVEICGTKQRPIAPERKPPRSGGGSLSYFIELSSNIKSIS